MTRKIKFKLHDLLDERQLTQKELAIRAGVRQNTVSDLLKDGKGGIRFETLEKIANALEIEDMNDIMELSEV